MTNNNNKYSPELRFPEFTDKWITKKLGEITINKDSKRCPISKTVRKKGIYPYYGANGIRDYVSDYIFDGEYLLVGEDGSVLTKENTPVIHWASGKFWVNNHAHVLSQKNGMSLKFISYVLSTIKIEGRVTGIPPKLNQDSLHTILIPIPSSPIEQKKIAACLSSLDIYLDTTKHKLELLKEYKKGLMQQLFPRNGKNVPELRFPEFTGEWAEKRLGDSFKERKEKNRNDLPLLSLGEKGLLYQSDTNRKDNSNTDKSKYLRIALGDIAYNTMRMWQGRCVFVDKEGIVSPAYTVCQPKEGIDSMFHYYLFKTHKMIEKFHRNSQGLVSDTLNLKFETFSKIKYFLPPSLTEQKKIADFLSKLDELIISESQQLEVLNAHKNGLMQRLFPKISTQDL